MLRTVLFLTVASIVCTADSDYYYPSNISRSTISGIAEYRSALTLDWLSHEDNRQRELALVFEMETDAPTQVLVSDCINYRKPASGKVATLMLELLKNLEGDEGILIPDFIQALIRAKLLVETSLLEAEPDLESLVKTPDVMMGEPHTTFPRILAMTWMAVTDPQTVKKNGWCSISKVTKYLLMTRSPLIAKHMRALDPVLARARFIIEEFIQHVTPNIYDKQNLMFAKLQSKSMDENHAMTRLPSKYHIHTKPPPKIRSHPANMELQQGSKIFTLPTTVTPRAENILIDESMLLQQQNEVNAAQVLVPTLKVILLIIMVFCL